ncbi:uncharacterized protein [Antedon mediterranea]|uniref:uncharacterized protein isoform X2 n=1 Tax=Antedon mediterranea TaxID=105859 RepID=UPI003AF69C64
MESSVYSLLSMTELPSSDLTSSEMTSSVFLSLSTLMPTPTPQLSTITPSQNQTSQPTTPQQNQTSQPTTPQQNQTSQPTTPQQNQTSQPTTPQNQTLSPTTLLLDQTSPPTTLLLDQTSPPTTPDQTTIPLENQVKITLSVDVNVDVQSESFKLELSYDLEELYIKGVEVKTRRKRRSIHRHDYVGGANNQEFIFHGLVGDRDRVKRNIDNSRKTHRRKVRQSDPNSDIEVVVTGVTRADDDATLTTANYYVVEDNAIVPADTVLNAYNQLNQSDYTDILPYEVVAMPSYAVSLPSTTSAPTREPHASHEDQLVMLIRVDRDEEEPAIVDLENNLEILYIEAEGRDRRKKRAIGQSNAVKMLNEKRYSSKFLSHGKIFIRKKRATNDPSETDEIYITDSRRTTSTSDEVYIQFFVYSSQAVIDGETALDTYKRLTTEDMSAQLGYEVLELKLLIEGTSYIAFWIALAVVIIFILIFIAIAVYFYCKKRTGKTEITSLQTVDRAVSALELGRFKVSIDRGKLIASETSFNEPRYRNGKHHSQGTQMKDTDLDEDIPVKIRASRKRSGRIHPSSSSVTSETSHTEMDQPLFSHVRERRPLPPAPVLIQNRSHFKNSVGVKNSAGLPPLAGKQLVANYVNDADNQTKKQLMVDARVPKSWYKSHLYLNIEELQYEISKWKKRQEQRSRRKEKKKTRKLMEEMERQRDDRERAQREIDSLFEEQKSAAANPTARNEISSQKNRWKSEGDEPLPRPKKKKKTKQFVASTSENVEMVSSRPLNSPIFIARSSSNYPPYDQHYKHKTKHRSQPTIQEPLLQRSDANSVFVVPSVPSAYYQHVEDEEFPTRTEVIQRKWHKERQRLNKMLDEVFAISTMVQEYPNHTYDSQQYNKPPYSTVMYSPQSFQGGYPELYDGSRYESDHVSSQPNTKVRERMRNTESYPFEIESRNMPSNNRINVEMNGYEEVQRELDVRLKELGQANTLVYDKKPKQGRSNRKVSPSSEEESKSQNENNGTPDQKLTQTDKYGSESDQVRKNDKKEPVPGRSNRKISPSSDEGSTNSVEAWKNTSDHDSPDKKLAEVNELDDLKEKNKELQRQLEQQQRTNVEKTLAEVGQSAKLGSGEPTISASAARQSESQEKQVASELSALGRLRKTIEEWSTKDTPQKTSIPLDQQEKVERRDTKNISQEEAQLSPVMGSKGTVLEENQQKSDTDGTGDQGSMASLVPGQVSNEDENPTKKEKERTEEESNMEEDSALSKLWNFVSSPFD